MTKTIAIVQGRMNSSRFPGKVLADLGGKPAISHTLRRTRAATRLDEVWLACSDTVADDPLADLADSLGIPVYRGDEHDVLGRFSAIAHDTNADRIVRITGDCPAIDAEIVDSAVDLIDRSGVDYVSNHLIRSFPDGLDVEVFTRAALEEADIKSTHAFLRTHVTPYIHGRLADRLPSGVFTRDNIVHPVDFSHLRWTLDEADDLVLLRRLFSALPHDFHWLDGVALMTREPNLFWINRKHELHAGTLKDLAAEERPKKKFDRSNQHFERAATAIPLAAQTFSKSYQQWSKGVAPLFLESGFGCRAKDPDGNVYIDYVQGLMPNILGYCDPDVDSAIRDQLDRGISFSLPTLLESDLAEKLIEIIPCAEMVRYGKNGSDATTGAIRLARGFTGRDKVAVAGYHGWHDWYIGTTVRNVGVPPAVSALSATFPFNNADALERLLAAEPDGFAAIILEPTGAVSAAEGFLERIRDLADAYGVVLIFDEIITGFRIDLGGAQKRFGVTPDLACFGKSMANGMPISAVTGRRDIMMLMEQVFVSGTFGGEALSIAAALATIDKLEHENVVERLWARGDRLIAESNKIFDKHGFNGILAFGGEGWWPRLTVNGPPVDPILMTSLLRQAFVSEGLLVAASYNLCLAHDTESVFAETLESLTRAVAAVRTQLDSPNPSAALKGDMIQPTFSVR